MSTHLKSLEGAPEVINGYFGTKWFSKDDYIDMKINRKLSKNFSEEQLKTLEDFS